MAHFVAPNDINLLIRPKNGPCFRFKSAGYRTTDPDQLLALRAEPRCIEQFSELDRRELVRPWIVNVSTGKLHNAGRRSGRCMLPDAIIEAAGEAEGLGPCEGTSEWLLYAREEDARRWNEGVKDCKNCIDTYRGA